MENLPKAEQNLIEQDNLNVFLENLNGVSWEYDLEKQKFTYVSNNAKKLLGYDLEEWTDFTFWQEMVHEEDREWASEYYSQVTSNGSNHHIEYRMTKKNGEVIWVLDAVSYDKNETSAKLFGFNIDITKKKTSQQQIEKKYKFLQTVLNGIADPVMIINNDYSVHLMNEKVQKQIEGRTFEDPKNPKCYEISHHRDSPCEGESDPCPLKNVIETKSSTKVLHNHKDENGNDNFVELAASPLFDDENNCIGIIECARNVTDHVVLTRELEAKTRELKYEATHDYLTGLPNRALFMDRLEQSIKDVDRNKNALTLFFMDLDHFKEINDTFGHHMGDAVLKDVCHRFQSHTRSNDILSRLAGDEFTVILKDVDNKNDASVIAQKFIDIFEKPLLVDGHYLKLSVSIGVSIYKYSSMSSYSTELQDKLLQSADTAMYKAKEKGKSNFQFASSSPSIS